MSLSMFVTNIIAIIMMAYSIIQLLPRVSRRLRIVLWLYIPLAGSVTGILFSFFSTPFFLLGILLILFFSERSFRIWNMSAALLGWMWCVLSSYIGSFLVSLMGYRYEQTQASNWQPWLLIAIALPFTCIPSALAGKWLRRKLHANPDFVPLPVLRLFFADVAVCAGIFLLNIIYGYTLGFPPTVLILSFLLFSAFAFVHLFLYRNLYRTTQENQRLALQAQARQSLTEYTRRLECHYQEMRRFRHDYMNLLSTLSGYIQARDWELLEHFFQTNLMGAGHSLSGKDAQIGRLSLIKVLEIKGILYVKIVEALNDGLFLTLEITDEISCIDMDPMSLSRLLGIYLDNALEAARASREKELKLIIYQKNDCIVFHIENTTPPLPAPLSQLSREGVSGKENHSGLGLYTARQIIDSCQNLSVSTEYRDHLFQQILTISHGGCK